MRLVCPNCDAKYEVPDDAIPESGRDVQCSSCGHAWFQLHPDAEIAAEDEAELFGDDLADAEPEPEMVPAIAATEAPAAEVAPFPESTAEPDPWDEADVPDAEASDHQASDLQESDPPPAAPLPEPVDDAAAAIAALIGATSAPPATAESAMAPRRELDDDVLSVLREEAEREAEARRSEAQRAGLRQADAEGQMQVQPDLGVDSPPAGAVLSPTQRRLAMLKGQDPDAPPPEPARPAARRDLLPDVEEINSTLQPGDTSALDDEIDALPDLTRQRSSFRNGFFLMILLLVIAAAAYVMAPQLSAQFPSLAGPMESYVTFVDGLRLWLNDMMSSATARLNGAGEEG
jgi:predicted Zn finger-like uncharacterized protein